MSSPSPRFRAKGLNGAKALLVPQLFASLLPLFLSIFLAQLASFPIRAQAAQERLSRSRDLAQAERLSQALMELDLVKQQNPKHARPYIDSGRALLAAGRLEDAQNELQQVARLKVEDPRLALDYAQALVGIGWLDRALETLSDLEGASQLEGEGLWLLSDLYYRQRRAEEARQALEKYASGHPGLPRANFRRAEIDFMAGDYPKAVSYLRQAVKANPDHAEAQYLLGQAMWLAYGSAESKQPLLKAAELEADDPKIWHTLGLVCFKLGDNEGAVRYLQRSSRLPGVASEVYFDLGNAYRKAGNTAQAQTALQTYQERHSAEEASGNQARMVEQLLNQGLRQFDQGALQDAIRSLLRVIEIESDHWQAHSFLAKAYLSLRQLAQARTHVEKMLEISPRNSEGSFLMALILYLQGDPQGALPYARESKGLLPGNPELRNLLGNIHLSLGEREAALGEYKAAVNLAPDNFSFRSNYNVVSGSQEKP